MKKSLLIALGLFWPMATSLLYAQTAAVTGRVTDPSGAVIAGAEVVLESIETGVKPSVVTNTEGYYNFPILQPGAYSLQVSHAGFRTASYRGLTLAVQQVARVDFTLELGAVEQKVDVSARNVLLDTETSSLGGVVSTTQITELPLLGRNPYALAMLVPGVRPPQQANDIPVDMFNNRFVSVNGGRGNQNSYMLDGAPNTEPTTNGPVIHTNPDFIEEFKVETNNFSADHGRAGGGVFNVVTRSGTNDLHFSLYEFLRNSDLNANSWFSNRAGLPRASSQLNQFGGSVGGPLELPHVYHGRNKTFVFGNLEFARIHSPDTYVNTVPTSQQLAGDFSATRNAAGQPIQIYDPLSTTAGPSGTFVRTLFPGNVVPLNRFDPVARNVVKFWPAPNGTVSLITGVNNFVHSGVTATEKDSFSIRVDHYISSQHRIFARFSYDKSPIRTDPEFGPSLAASSPNNGPQIFNRRNTVVEDTYTISASWLALNRVSYSRMGNLRTPYGLGFDLPSVGFPQTLVGQVNQITFPAVQVTGLAPMGNTSLIRFGLDTWAWQPQMTKSLERHLLKFGYDLQVQRANEYTNAGFTFGSTQAWTQGPNANQSSAAAGYGLASFELGVVSGTVINTAAVAKQTVYHGLFFQDDYKPTPRLTLNLGLRYEYEAPSTDRFNQISNFDFSQKPPLVAPGLNLAGTLSFVGVNGAPRGQNAPDRNNFAPRLGLAFKLTPKTVIRTGAGIFYSPTTGESTSLISSGFSVNTSVVTSLDGVTPYTFLSNPYPTGVNQVTGSKLGPATLLGQAVSFFDRGNRLAYAGQWNFDVQQELPGAVLLDVGYVGTRGLKLPINRQYDQLPDADLALGTQLQKQVANPFLGQISVGSLATATVAQALLLRPFPQFAGVTSLNAHWGTELYNALQVSVQKRYRRGLQFTLAYTWSKNMDQDSGLFSGETLGGGAIQDWNNLRPAWAVSTLDQTRRLLVNTVYQLPWGARWHGPAGKILAGWQLSGIFSDLSGVPLGVTSAVNGTFSQGGGQSPNWTGVNPCLPNPTPDRWLDNSQFSNPPAFTFGNTPRTFGGCRANGTWNIDFNASKTTRLWEKLALQFRAEAFNLTNTVRFNPPNTVFGNPNFGVITSAGSQPRVIQFGLKLIY